jgi:hypothetical protein
LEGELDHNESERVSHLNRFYSLLTLLQEKTPGPRLLKDCAGQMGWPTRGVYFFMEDGEVRTDSGSGLRIVRVGTHALHAGSRTRLWNRLSQHKGQRQSRGGNHRGSIFRLLVGASLIARQGYAFPSWGRGNNAAADVRAGEIALEQEVSRVIGSMPFLWLAVEDDAGPGSLRGYIERNSIALLSDYEKPPLDPPSSDWLGRHCDRQRVRNSGLWNSNHVDERYDLDFLASLEQLVLDIRPTP